jgi:hypothetical protein
MSLASALGLDNEIALLKSRGFAVYEARTVGGPDGKFRVGSSFMDAAEVRTIANRQADRFPDNPYLPRKAAPGNRGQQQPPPKCSARLQVTPKPKEIVMSDRLRGMNEADVRSDMETVADEHGSQIAAARAVGLDKNRWNNTRAGYVRIGDDIMLALYGPEGTTLRAEIRKHLQPVAEETTPETALPDTTPQEEGVAPPPLSQQPTPEEDQADALSLAADGGTEPTVQICTPPQEQQLIFQPFEVPDWMAPAIDALSQQHNRFVEEMQRAQEQLDKINAAERALLALAA